MLLFWRVCVAWPVHSVTVFDTVSVASCGVTLLRKYWLYQCQCWHTLADTCSVHTSAEVPMFILGLSILYTSAEVPMFILGLSILYTSAEVPMFILGLSILVLKCPCSYWFCLYQRWSAHVHTGSVYTSAEVPLFMLVLSVLVLIYPCSYWVCLY